MSQATNGSVPHGHCECQGGNHLASFINAHGIPVSLTPQQLEVLKLLQEGMSTKMIAKTLVIAIATARNHIQAIITKVGVHSRVELLSFASKQDLDGELAKRIELANKIALAQQEMELIVAGAAKKAELEARVARAEAELALREEAEAELLDLEVRAERAEAKLAEFGVVSRVGMSVQ